MYLLIKCSKDFLRILLTGLVIYFVVMIESKSQYHGQGDSRRLSLIAFSPRIY
ncbi:hypothetical protein Sjap_011520 [Stephania japonica]|uniref:Uncharacterized protein n=1 Tax=Stephania japonica TaxID=461633 RepID=A0AAP0P536_9MAGN